MNVVVGGGGVGVVEDMGTAIAFTLALYKDVNVMCMGNDAQILLLCVGMWFCGCVGIVVVL